MFSHFLVYHFSVKTESLLNCCAVSRQRLSESLWSLECNMTFMTLSSSKFLFIIPVSFTIHCLIEMQRLPSSSRKVDTEWMTIFRASFHALNSQDRICREICICFPFVCQKLEILSSLFVFLLRDVSRSSSRRRDEKRCIRKDLVQVQRQQQKSRDEREQISADSLKVSLN